MSKLNQPRPVVTGAVDKLKGSSNGYFLPLYHGGNSQSTLLDAALAWLALGVPVLPVQPGSKRLVSGFGPRSRKITNPDQARAWFDRRFPPNLAVVTGGAAGLLCLDFDDMATFEWWQARPGADVCAQTRLETSRRGVHAFVFSDQAEGLRSTRIASGLEVKAGGGVVLASPSVVRGVVYQVISGAPPVRVDLADLARLLPDSSLLSKRDSTLPALSRKVNGVGLVADIKRHFDILALANELQAMRKLDPLKRTGQTFGGSCPFHSPDLNPSFYVDPVRGFFACRSCGARGDAINLYAVLRGLDVVEAISEMARALPGRGARRAIS